MDVDDLVREMEEFLDISDEGEEDLQQHPVRRYFKETKAMYRTTADILETPDCYMFVLDMPGLDANNIKAKVEHNILHVAGKKKKPQLHPEVKVIRMERRRARYMRKFSLPRDSNLEDIKASYKDGVLTVTVAKRQPPEAEKPKSFTIPIS